MQGWLGVCSLYLITSLIFTTISLSLLQPCSNHTKELGCSMLASQHQLCLKLVCQGNFGPASLDSDSLAEHVGLSSQPALILSKLAGWSQSQQGIWRAGQAGVKVSSSNSNIRRLFNHLLVPRSDSSQRRGWDGSAL